MHQRKHQSILIARALFASVISGTLFVATIARAEPVTLTNKEGQSVEARILDYSSGSVRIRRVADDRTFPPIDIATFDEKSQAIIRNWALDRAMAANRLLEATVRRREADVKRERGLIDVKTYRGFYSVKFRNISPMELQNLKVEYLIFRTQGVAGSGQNALYQRRKGEENFETLASREEVEFDTMAYEMEETQLAPGLYWADGSPRRTSSRLEGLWLRVYVTESATEGDDKKKRQSSTAEPRMIFEYMVPEGLSSREEW